MPPTPTGARPPDPLIQARYQVEFSKLTGLFSEVGAASGEVAPIGYNYTGPDGHPQYTVQPGLRKPASITLKRGATGDLSAWTWHQEVLDGKMATARVSGTISMLDAEGKPTAVFNVINAWPSKVDMPGLNSAGTAAVTETITLTCERFERSQ
jgi:phage tail-like protein